MEMIRNHANEKKKKEKKNWIWRVCQICRETMQSRATTIIEQVSSVPISPLKFPFAIDPDELQNNSYKGTHRLQYHLIDKKSSDEELEILSSSTKKTSNGGKKKRQRYIHTVQCLFLQTDRSADRDTSPSITSSEETDALQHHLRMRLPGEEWWVNWFQSAPP